MEQTFQACMPAPYHSVIPSEAGLLAFANDPAESRNLLFKAKSGAYGLPSASAVFRGPQNARCSRDGWESLPCFAVSPGEREED